MGLKKILFVDRDGTLIIEPEDKQIDSLEKLGLIDDVIPSLLRLQSGGYRIVMVSSQDGLGTASFPTPDFEIAQTKLLQLLNSQGIVFEAILICPHLPEEGCDCRKPRLGLVQNYLSQSDWDRKRSAMVGDRDSDIQLAKNMGIQGFQIGKEGLGWKEITDQLLGASRTAKKERKTKETSVSVEANIDGEGTADISTGIAYFDHMLEQLAKHGGMDLKIHVKGDLHVDEHHTVEDTALCLGEVIRLAVGDKFGINRYGFVIPMDESEAHVSLDLCGRSQFVFQGSFPREYVGKLPTELVSHFFRSLSDTLQATLHMKVEGENSHHMVEALFKCFARSLRSAMAQTSQQGLPSTKGEL